VYVCITDRRGLPEAASLLRRLRGGEPRAGATG
jgi:hypothetical protein